MKNSTDSKKISSAEKDKRKPALKKANDSTFKVGKNF